MDSHAFSSSVDKKSALRNSGVLGIFFLLLYHYHQHTEWISIVDSLLAGHLYINNKQQGHQERIKSFNQIVFLKTDI